MKQDAKEAEKLKELLAQAEGHPMMKTILAEKAAAVLATRMEAAGKIENLQKEQKEAILKLQGDLDAKEAEYKTATAAMDAARNALQTAGARLSMERASFDAAIGRQEQVLIESADPVLDAAITFFKDKLDYLRSPGRISSNRMGGERNIFTLKTTLKAESNEDAVNSAIHYCMAAIKRLERMKLTPTIDLQEIEGMKKGIPDINIYTESTGERPFPRINTDIRTTLPNDSETEWKIGKLNEKFKKLMGRP